MEKKNKNSKKEDLFSIVIVIIIVALLIIFSIKSGKEKGNEPPGVVNTVVDSAEKSFQEALTKKESKPHFTDIKPEELPFNIISSHASESGFVFFGSATPVLIRTDIEKGIFQKAELIFDKLTGFNSIKCFTQIDHEITLAPQINEISGEVSQNNQLQEIVKITENEDFPMAVGTASGLYLYSKENGFEFIDAFKEKSVFALGSFDGKVFVSTPLALHSMDIKTREVVQYSITYTNAPRTISKFIKYVDSSGKWHLLAICHKDIYEFIPEMQRFEMAFSQLELSRHMDERYFVTDMAFFTEFIAVATSGDGILIFDRLGQNMKKYGVINGLPDEYVTNFYSTPQGILIIGTFNGIGVISSNDLLELQPCQVLREKDGMLSGNVRSIANLGNTVFLSFQDGVVQMKINPLLKNQLNEQEDNLITNPMNNVSSQAVGSSQKKIKSYVSDISPLFNKTQKIPSMAVIQSKSKDPQGIFAPRESEYPIDSFVVHNNKVIYLKFNSGLKEMDLESRKIESVKNSLIPAEERIITMNSQGRYLWLETVNGYGFIDESIGEQKYYKKPLFLSGGNQLSVYSVFSGKRVVLIPPEGNVRIFDAQVEEWGELDLKNSRKDIISLVRIKDNLLYYVRGGSVYRYDRTSETELFGLPQSKSSDLFVDAGMADQVTDMIVENDKIYIAFARSGIYCYDFSGKIIFNYNSVNGMVDSMVNSLAIYKNYLVACCSDGVLFIDPNNNSADFYDQSNGIVGRTVVECRVINFKNRDLAFFRTDSAVLSFDGKKWVNYLLP